MSLNQLFFMRPAFGYAQYHTPIPGMPLMRSSGPLTHKTFRTVPVWFWRSSRWWGHGRCWQKLQPSNPPFTGGMKGTPKMLTATTLLGLASFFSFVEFCTGQGLFTALR